jgi:hypothetical protein
MCGLNYDELMRYMTSLGVTLDSMLFVELTADQEERLKRNKSEERLLEKRTKRNIDESEKFIFELERKHKFNSDGDFIYSSQHIKIDNTFLSPTEVTNRILEEFWTRILT